MRTKRLHLFVTLTAIFSAAMPTCGLAAHPGSGWLLARPGWSYAFPRDHRSHEGFKTEWWYFTGNLAAEDGREFGFQLTFFRQGIRPSPPPQSGNRFAVRDIALAHFAITEVTGGAFRFAQRLARADGITAGFGSADRIAWNGSWTLDLAGPKGAMILRADDPDQGLALELELAPQKPVVLHGADGVSQKSAGEGRASHYYSFTRLAAAGRLTFAGREHTVRGHSWYDHEWATNQLTEEQSGWDWFSLVFDDGSELMLFQIRLKGGGRDPFSHGTFVRADGTTLAVKDGDFTLEPRRVWTSPDTGGRYPVEWVLRVAPLGLDLRVQAALDQQELVLEPISYWEGSIRAAGTHQGREVRARGYLEMTGYGGGLVGLQAPSEP